MQRLGDARSTESYRLLRAVVAHVALYDGISVTHVDWLGKEHARMPC